LEFEKKSPLKIRHLRLSKLRAAPDCFPDRRENEIPNECVGGLEKCWWENGTPELFSPNLITLAEKMGFK
jgi:hypothetical protein